MHNIEGAFQFQCVSGPKRCELFILIPVFKAEIFCFSVLHSKYKKKETWTLRYTERKNLWITSGHSVRCFHNIKINSIFLTPHKIGSNIKAERKICYTWKYFSSTWNTCLLEAADTRTTLSRQRFYFGSFRTMMCWKNTSGFGNFQ